MSQRNTFCSTCRACTFKTMQPATDCKFGSSCTRDNCVFAHASPAGSAYMAGTEARACTLGIKCTRGDCQFAHPSRAMKCEAAGSSRKSSCKVNPSKAEHGQGKKRKKRKRETSERGSSRSGAKTSEGEDEQSQGTDSQLEEAQNGGGWAGSLPLRLLEPHTWKLAHGCLTVRNPFVGTTPYFKNNEKKSPTSRESVTRSGEVPKVSEETTNFARYWRLLFHAGQDVLAAVFKGSFRDSYDL